MSDRINFDIFKNVMFNNEDIFMMDQLNELQAFVNLYQAGVREVHTRLSNLADEFETKYQHNPIQYITTRVKGLQSIANKLVKKNLDVSTQNAHKYLKDIGGVRVVCSYIEDIYSVAKYLLSQQDIQLMDKRDYIQQPKENGYRSLHLVVSVPVYLSSGKQEVLIEIQLRTIAMDFWASLEHDLQYKTLLDEHPEMIKRLKVCAEQANALDQTMQQIYYDSMAHYLKK